MNRRICFFEPNRVFAERLIDYWQGHGLEQYRICHYSDRERWKSALAGPEPELWIVDVSLREERGSLPRGRVLWWTEQENEPDAVFKYRSAAVLLHVIQSYLTAEGRNRRPDGAQVVSLYSPIKRCLQTTFGITLSHTLSRRGRVLYLNLEGYSGLDRMLRSSFSKDISDFIYSINHSKEEIPLLIQNYIYRLGEVDMIPPVLNPSNLQDISEETWLYILHKLRESSAYDYILLDVSDYIRGVFGLLGESDVVFSITKSDAKASAKWQQYCSLLEESGYGDVLTRTRNREIPQMMELPVNLEEYMPGPLSEFAESVAKEAGLL